MKCKAMGFSISSIPTAIAINTFGVTRVINEGGSLHTFN